MSKTKNSKDTSPGQNLSQKELVKVYGRIHSSLAKKLKEAKRDDVKAKGKDPKARKRYNDAAKDLYAYVRLMELCQVLSKDVVDMREILETISLSSLTQSGKPN